MQVRILLSAIQNKLFLNTGKMKPSLKAMLQCNFFLIYYSGLQSGMSNIFSGQEENISTSVTHVYK